MFLPSPPAATPAPAPPPPPPVLERRLRTALYLASLLTQENGSLRATWPRYQDDLGYDERKELSHLRGLPAERIPPPNRRRALSLCWSAREWREWDVFEPDVLGRFDAGNWLYNAIVENLYGIGNAQGLTAPYQITQLSGEHRGDLVESVLGMFVLLVLTDSGRRAFHNAGHMGDEVLHRAHDEVVRLTIMAVPVAPVGVKTLVTLWW